MTDHKHEITNSDEVDFARVSATLLTTLLQDLPDQNPMSIQIGNQELIV